MVLKLERHTALRSQKSSSLVSYPSWFLRARTAGQPPLGVSKVAYSHSWRAVTLLQRYRGRLSPSTRLFSSRSASSGAAASLHQRQQGLSAEQTAAVTASDRLLRIDAVPGSGKTRVLISRIAHLIQERGVSPRKILAITFTRKAAGQLQQRIAASLGERAASEVVSGTFHSLAASLLRLHVSLLPSCGRNRRFQILDQADSIGTMTTLLKEQGRAPLERRFAAGDMSEASFKTALKDSNKRAVGFGKTLHQSISTLKGALTSHFGLSGQQAIQRLVKHQTRHDNPGLLSFMSEEFLREDLPGAFDAYNERLKSLNQFDYDDLMAGIVALLTDRPELCTRYQRAYTHVLVDEFQDTNAAQYRMIHQLIGQEGNLFVVGDPDQAIYGWRGANSDYMQTMLDHDFPGLVTMRLRDNYRSTPQILAAASWSLAGQDPVQAGRLPFHPQSPDGPAVEVKATEDGQQEAQWVIEKLQDLIRNGGFQLRDCAILFRRHLQARLFEQAMVVAGIPYILLGGEPFWGRREVKDVMAYLNLLADLHNDAALLRIINMPKRALGDKALSGLLSWAKLQGNSLGACLFADFPASAIPARPLLEASLPSRVQMMQLRQPDPPAQQRALAELRAAVVQQLPQLPSAKDMGITPAAYKALSEFRSQMAIIRLQAEICEPDEVMEVVTDAIDLEDYIKSGSFSKQGDPLERWDRVRLLQTLVKEFQGADKLETWEEEQVVEYTPQPQRRLEGMDPLQAFVNDAALFSPDDMAAKRETNAVRLCTIHASKGLEFPVVFVVGCEEGNLPLLRELDCPESFIAEEIRCAYVALTRAEKRLFITHAAERYVFGSLQGQSPSHLVDLIEASQGLC